MKVLRNRWFVALMVCGISTALFAGCPRVGRTLLKVKNNTLLGVTSVHIVESGADTWGKPDIKSIPVGRTCKTLVKGDSLDLLIQFANPRPQDKGGCEIIYNSSLEIYGWEPVDHLHCLALSQADACTDVYYEFDPEENDN